MDDSAFPEPDLSVLALGFEDHGFTAYEETASGLMKISLQAPSASPDWSRFQTVVIDATYFLRGDPDGFTFADPRDTELLLKAIMRTSAAGVPVCLLYSDLPATGSSATGLAGRQLDAEEYSVANAVLAHHQVVCARESPMVVHRATAPQLENYLERYAICNTILIPRESAAVTVLSVAESTDAITGVGLNESLFVLPGRSPAATHASLTEFVGAAADAILRYCRARENASGEWLAELKLPGEADLEVRQSELLAGLRDVREAMASLAEPKSLLLMSGEPLVDAVCELLDIIDWGTDQTEERAEDFWLLDSSGSRVALVEVKGVGSNVQKSHVGQVESHRVRRELPEQFPGLLIVNTFRKSGQLAERVRAIDTAVTVLAARHNVLVMRALDLLYLSCAHEPADAHAKLQDGLLAGGGWLRVTDAGMELLKS